MNIVKRGGVLIACGFVSAAIGQGYSFTVLQSDIPNSNHNCIAFGISGDGNVIAGGNTGYGIGERPWIWRRVGSSWVRSQLPVPPLSEGLQQDQGRGVSLSYDGNVVVGMAGTSVITDVPLATVFYGRPAVWTNVLSGNPVLQVVPLGSQNRGACAGVTADGTETVWWANYVTGTPRREIWRWHIGGSMEMVLPENPPSTDRYVMGSLITACLVSGDGTRFGHQRNFQAFLRAGAETIALGGPIPPQSAGEYHIAAMSSNGQVLVGYGYESGLTRPVVWYADGTSVMLPSGMVSAPLMGGILAVSSDGAVMGGFGSDTPLPHYASGSISPPGGARASVWINLQARSLEQILIPQGVNLQGVVPSAVTGISADGTVLVGYGMQSSPQRLVSFVATILPPGVCDDIDFNRDGNRFDPMDIDAFLSRYSEGPCIPASAQCRDIDFNNDGSLFDPRDIEAFLSVFSEGPCL